MKREKNKEYYVTLNQFSDHVFDRDVTYQRVTIVFQEITSEYIDYVAKLVDYKFNALGTSVYPRTMLSSTHYF